MSEITWVQIEITKSLAKEGKLNTSDYIFRLWSYLEQLGVSVEINYDLPCSSLIIYDQKKIFYNESRVFYALITLAHQGGHWLHYLRNPHLEQNRTKEYCECAAYLYGWTLLKKVGATRLINKALYQEFGIASGCQHDQNTIHL